MQSMHLNRVVNKIKTAIDDLSLDLKGKIVLTEAATGSYCVTPIIAALSGAEKVYAFTQSTKYGTIEDVRKQTNSLIKILPEISKKIEIITELSPKIISSADVITNSGHLRPINAEKLQFVKKGCVISLMYESWELRESDIDVKYCKQKNIIIGATNERHPSIDVFNYLGDMALKQIFDAGLNPYNNKFILLCNNEFGPYIAKTLSKVCDQLCVIDNTSNKKKYSGLKVDWSDSFRNINIPEKYKDSDGILFTAHPFNKTWIGDAHSDIPIEILMNQMDNPYIIRFAGDIDEEYCANKIKFYPKNVVSGHMGIIPSEIGGDPIIRLQSGGLKVAEYLIKGECIYNNSSLLDKL